MQKTKTVEAYLQKSGWQKELTALRDILKQTELEECIKWGSPTYTLQGKNVVAFSGFKNHFALWFHNGVFLKDKDNELINAQEGTTKGLRQWRFTSMEQINAEKILAYVQEAIKNQKQGLSIQPAQKQVSMPAELDEALDQNPQLRQQFDALTPGRRKEYAEYIGAAKQEKTRLSRLEKCMPLILNGLGLNDKYR